MITNRIKIFFIPFITVLIMLTSVSLMILFGYRTFDEVIGVFSHRITISLGNAVVTVTLFYFAVKWFNKKVDWNNKWGIRLLMDAGLIVAHSLLGIFFINYMINNGFMGHDPESPGKELLYIMPLVMDTLFLVLIELIMAMEERTKLELQVAQLEKEQINAKYGALKEQLDHHFLFNNLSVLSSLIYEDVYKADHFIQDFSSIYRYVLQINQRNLVTVEEELEFINNYLHLYKFRFEEGFEYHLDVKDSGNWQIPPLTLQVLVENAIKHNMVSRHKPLILEIIGGDGELLIKNNYQPKKDREPSTQKGQLNLLEKYRLLGSRLPEFKWQNDEYLVIIPLIKP
jgi:hypothetical protein